MYRAKLFGADVRFAWEQWEHQFFDIYGGDLRKKASAQVLTGRGKAQVPRSSSMNVSLKGPCRHRFLPSESEGCVLEFPDHFVHVAHSS
mmetsp:Transcript_95675/g.270761  ORF Transcript_95675/g.270761 Transcript_95675/m.270761 type:complete len:89 (-) Transcript_95675:161-427(-)